MSRAWENNPDLNEMELIKLKKDGLDILDDLNRFAEEGFENISEADLALLKWAGCYLQKPVSDGYFLMRVKIPGGILSSEQARTLAGIAQDYGRSQLNITTRQALQFHWLTVKDFPDVFNRLALVGLSSVEACGDCPRTVVGNILAGIDPHELFDVRDIVQEVADYLEYNRKYSNLPRKFKVSISSSVYNSGHAEINDLAFVPSIKAINEGELVQGFNILVGGGLSTKPLLAKQLDIFVQPAEVLTVVKAVAAIFRDHGYRRNRRQARLKYLVADWGAEKFTKEVLKLTGPLPSKGVDMKRGWNGGYFYGVQRQKQKDFKYVGLNVPLGRLEAKELAELANLADRYGDGSLRTCNSQNILLPNIPDDKVKYLLKENLLQHLSPTPKSFIGYAITCPGKEFCSLGLVETRNRLESIVNALDKIFVLDSPIRIHMNGCPNSCGQQQIADIGLQGSLRKIHGRLTETFEISLGGTLGQYPSFNTKLNGHIAADHLTKALEHLVVFYLENRMNDESFHRYLKRVGIEAFQAKLDQLKGWIDMVA